MDYFMTDINIWKFVVDKYVIVPELISQYKQYNNNNTTINKTNSNNNNSNNNSNNN